VLEMGVEPTQALSLFGLCSCAPQIETQNRILLDHLFVFCGGVS